MGNERMNIPGLAELRGVGQLLADNTSTEEIVGLVDQANQVRWEGNAGVAKSSATAAAWLLCMGDANAFGCVEQHGFSPVAKGRLWGYRGQNGAYKTIVPRLHRLRAHERLEWNRAFTWFHAAISVWHNTYFRYRNGSVDACGVEHDAALGVAQHYGLPTCLVDWTWDPLVAMAFAMAELEPGEQGVVFVRDFGDGREPTRSYNVHLPATFVQRAWYQRGCFAWHPVPPESFRDPVVRTIDGGLSEARTDVRHYRRLTFSACYADIKWAREHRNVLMRDEAPWIGDLAKWSRDAAQRGAQGPTHPQVSDMKGLRARCQSCGLEIPGFNVETCDSAATENVSLTMDYLDQMAAIRDPRDGRIKYYIPFLLTACAGMPWYSWVNSPNDQASGDPRAEVFTEGGVRRVGYWHEDLRKLKALGQVVPVLVDAMLVLRLPPRM